MNRQLPLPPEPKLSRWTQTRRMGEDPFAFIAACREECGDMFRIAPFGMGPTLVLCSPETLSELFKKREHEVITGEVRGRVFGHIIGDDFSLWLDGDAYVERRRATLPFLTGQRLLSQIPALREIVTDEVRSWPEHEVVSILDGADRISRRVIQHLIFGPHVEQDLDESCRRFLAACRSPWIYVKWLRWDLGRWTPWGRFVRIRRDLEDRLDDEVKRLLDRDANVENHREVEHGHMVASLVDHLGAAGEPERRSIVHEVMALLVAGAETTSKMITWILLDLLEQPETIEGIRRELDEVVGSGEIESRHLRELPRLHALVEEGLRFRAPAAVAGPRMAQQDLELGGFHVPAGTIIVQSISESGINQRFPDPHRFDLEANQLDRRVAESDSYHFGGGIRRCTGYAVAQVEMALVLAEIVRTFDVERVGEGDSPEKDGIAFSPPRGLEVRLRRRDAGLRRDTGFRNNAA